MRTIVPKVRSPALAPVGVCALAALALVAVRPAAGRSLTDPGPVVAGDPGVALVALAPIKVKVTTTPQTARVYVNGVLTGTGKVVVTVPKTTCVTVEVKLEGYIMETRSYCNQRGMTVPKPTDYVKLQPDESYSASVQSNVANNEVLLSVGKNKSKEDAWRAVVQTVLGKFDVLESNDEKAGYLRTAWVGVVFAASNNTIRTRVIVKLASDDPLAYRLKFISEESGKAGTPFSADEQFRPFPRILKQYDGMIEELTTRLAN